MANILIGNLSLAPTPLVGSDLLLTSRGGVFANQAKLSDVGNFVSVPLASTTEGQGIDLVGRGVKRLASYAEAHALTAATTVSAFFVTSADGGLFRRDPTDTTSAEDGGGFCGTVIRSLDFATNGVWKRDYSGALSPHWYGAVGDGVADDTVPLQTVFNKGGLIQLRALTYLFSSLTINTNYTTVQGAGIYKTILKPTATAVDAISIATTSNVSNSAIRDLQIYGNGTSTAGLVLGSSSFSAAKVIIDRVAISFFTSATSGSGIRLVNAFWISIQDECDLNGNYNNIFIPAAGIVTTLEVSGNTTISNAVNQGVLSSSNVLSNVDKVIFRHMSFEHNVKEAVFSTSPGTVWVFDQTYFEQNSTSGTGSINISSSISSAYNFAVVHAREMIFHTTISGPEMVFGYVQQSTVENCEGVNSITTGSTSIIKFGYMRGKRPANILSLYAGLLGTIVAEDIDTATGKRFFYNSGADLLSGHFGSTQITAPTVAALAGAGTAPTVVLASGSTDVSGQIQYTPGAGATAGTNVRLTFNRSYVNAPFVLVTYGSSDGASAPQMFVAPQVGTPSTYCDIGFVNTPVAGLKYINYMVIGS